jgi:outer membrane receptor protein involved in Fe transport
VLGAAVSAPLFTYFPGYGLIHARGGYRVREGSDLYFAFENIADHPYRGISWGIDGPGRSVSINYRMRF